MTLIRGVFSFDYMGAAEFEFGAVPAALQTMDQRRLDLRASSIEIPLSQVATHWRKKANATPPSGQATVYLLAPGEWIEEVDRRVRRWAADGWQERLKESTRLSGALRPVEKWDSETRGWLELDNGFMFFVDEKMWRSCCALFGVRAEVSA